MKSLLAIRNVNIRLKRPHRDAPVKGRIFKGFRIEVDEDVVGENINGISRWYRKGEEFYWGGGFSELNDKSTPSKARIDSSSTIVAWGEQLLAKEPLPEWWGNTGNGVRVAVVGGGIFHEHTNLLDALMGEAHGDFTQAPFSDSPGKDKTGQGTGIAGIIGARSRQSVETGVIGVAPDVKIRDIKVADDTEISGNGFNHVLNILTRQDKHRVDVVVLGLGLSGVAVRLDLIQKLVAQGVIFIAPAGDATPGPDELLQGDLFDSIYVPAHLSLCISVGTINSRVKALLGSSDKRTFASGLDYLAPHRPVYSCNSPDSTDPSLYKKHRGSPFAAAFLAGLVARILEKRGEGGYRLPMVREELDKVAFDLDAMEFDAQMYQPLSKTA